MNFYIGPSGNAATKALANQCKGCLWFDAPGYGGLVNGLCLDCRNPEVLERTPQQEQELEVMRSRGDL